MYCSRCGAPISLNSAFCAACGAPVSLTSGAGPSLTRPSIITVLAVLQFFGATIWLLAGLVTTVSLLAGNPVQAEAALAGLLLVALGALQLTCGVGLWKLKSYGRTLQLAFAWIGLIAIPIGTVIAILILVYLFKPGIKVLFSGKQANELTAAELGHVGALGQGSLATVIVILVAAFASIAVIGIIAAIAVPGLLRARMSGNEASAIGSLRAINSAQQAFAASCGNGFYAATLASLAVPPTSEQVGFISSDLALDPSIKSGYTIALSGGGKVPDAPIACNGASVGVTYFVSAEPVTMGSTGTRFFATNQEGAIFHSQSAIAVTHVGMPAGATPIQ